MKSRPWIGWALGFIVICTMPLTVATSAGHLDRPWPMLLSNEQTSDLRVAMLQYRANAMLEKLVQTTPATE